MPDREPGDTRGWILDEVIATHAGRVSTHYAGCWRYHAGCLARLLLSIESGNHDNGGVSGFHDGPPIWMGEHT